MTKILFAFLVFAAASVCASSDWFHQDAGVPQKPVSFFDEEEFLDAGPPKGSHLETYLRILPNASHAREVSSSNAEEGAPQPFSRKETLQKENYHGKGTGRHMLWDRDWVITRSQCLFEGYSNLGDIYVRRNLVHFAVQAYQTALEEGGLYVTANKRTRVKNALDLLLLSTRT